jgi:hypothetical protein
VHDYFVVPESIGKAKNGAKIQDGHQAHFFYCSIILYVICTAIKILDFE